MWPVLNFEKKKIGCGTHSDTTFGRRGGRGVCNTDAKKKRFRNAVPISVLLRKNFQNGVSARSVKNIPGFEEGIE
jgi:hypothetical protein